MNFGEFFSSVIQKEGKGLKLLVAVRGECEASSTAIVISTFIVIVISTKVRTQPPSLWVPFCNGITSVLGNRRISIDQSFLSVYLLI
jgi:hypothetical protein